MAQRLIDANKMREDWLENGENEFVYDTNAVLESIDNQPTVDAVPVVRCKDCKYSLFIKSCSKYECKKGHGSLKYSTDFCSDGERKDGDGE